MARTSTSVVKKSTQKVVKKATGVDATKFTKKEERISSEQSCSLPMVTMEGSFVSPVAVPKEIFSEKVNKKLLSQAVRVFLANQRAGSASAKTRSEVQGSSRKIYRQKGTGRARHGTVRAPIFVKGGVAHGPRPIDYTLSFTRSMAKQALISSLSDHHASKRITVLDTKDVKQPKTKTMAKILNKLQFTKRILIVSEKKDTAIMQMSKNIKGVTVIPGSDLHAYAVLVSQYMLIDKKALPELISRLQSHT